MIMVSGIYTRPGGGPTPFNPAPPSGADPIHIPITPTYVPGILPGEHDHGTSTPEPGEPGDTQVSYVNAPAAPTPLTTWEFQAGTPISVNYIESGALSTSTAEAHGLPPINLYTAANAAGQAVPGSIRFEFRGRTYVDRSGSLYYAIDPQTNAGILGGSYDYDNNVATLTDYASGGNTVNVISMATRYTDQGVTGIMFRTNGSPLRIGSFTLRATTLDGTQLIATVDVNGNITGSLIKGLIDWTTGLVTVVFGEPVVASGNESEDWYNADIIDVSGNIWKPTHIDPATIFFGTVIFHAVPVDPSLIGIDPVRLPSNGLVSGYNPGGIGVLSHTQVTAQPSPVAGATVNLGRARISYIEVYDSNLEPVDDVWYTIDMDAGTLTWASTLNLAAYILPIYIRDRIQDVGLISDVQITGQVTLASQITHDYPADAMLSSAILTQDKQARVDNIFDQATYSAGTWSDELVGSPAEATYNTITYPVEVENGACIDERWAMVFNGTSVVDVIGETVGQVLTGVSILSDIAPINPVTITAGNPGGKPYFTIRKEGWGGGWSAGNVLRYNNISATIPLWLARVVTPGTLTQPNDAVRAQLYGNAH